MTNFRGNPRYLAKGHELDTAIAPGEAPSKITIGTVKVDGDRLRSLFLKYFSEHGHAVIPSASVIPENDPSVLFTTAGMHPLVPYLMGRTHPAGNRLADAQKCVRTNDIEEVGDATHLTFFEMLGNWSLGDYFKAESIAFSWEFLTSPDWMGLPKERIGVSLLRRRQRRAARRGILHGLAQPRRAGRAHRLPRHRG
jgi:alanyl-tRNA synthetase